MDTAALLSAWQTAYYENQTATNRKLASEAEFAVADTNLTDATAAKSAIDAQVATDPTNADLLQQQADAEAALAVAQQTYNGAYDALIHADNIAKATSSALTAAMVAAQAAGVTWTPPS